MTKVTSTAELLERLASRGYQPRRDELEPLLLIVTDGEREAAEAASRALARLGGAAAEAAMARFAAAPPRARARLCRLAGRVAAALAQQAAGGVAARLRQFLLRALADADEKTARNAALALGRLPGDGEIEDALVARLAGAPPPLLRALVEALGKVGTARARAALDELAAAPPPGDAELLRLLDEARLKLARTLERTQGGRIRDDVAPRAPLPVLVHCRHGLARLCADELASLGARVVDDETVALTLRAPLSALFAARTMLRFGFPLSIPRVADAGSALVAALSSDAAWQIFSQFTDGPMRYRIEWAQAGHRRGLTFRSAALVTQARPALINDPTASLWEAIVREDGGCSVELWPRGLADPRFAYRRAHVPASSHPTLAAALARVAGARADDVVWDPFTGAGSELIERARLGPYARLYGSDADAGALELARANLAAAGVQAELAVADARHFSPPETPTLILTNPPMGRRVLDRHATGALYRDFLTHAARLLAPGGRLVWISPRGDETLALAEPLGLRCSLRQRVDMAGFWGELQAFTRGSAAAARFGAQRPEATAPPRRPGPPRSRKTRR